MLPIPDETSIADTVEYKTTSMNRFAPATEGRNMPAHADDESDAWPKGLFHRHFILTANTRLRQGYAGQAVSPLLNFVVLHP
jgi:hypothetical protein